MPNWYTVRHRYDGVTLTGYVSVDSSCHKLCHMFGRSVLLSILFNNPKYQCLDALVIQVAKAKDVTSILVFIS